ncbi:hypothetical protein [Gorillibacterium massiliense]|uniref:hypothetical protein n=1 Tax=Gorillibacterium massiliense TaxID=1280390 RepID=UPI0004AEFE17|nr:hypothetical protein [Gorillibacterium massiliense]
MNRTAGVLKTFFADKTSWLFIPHAILFSTFVVNLIVGYLSNHEYYTGGLSSLYIYMFVVGILYVVQNFPFLISFGARRKDYFIGSALAAFLLFVLEAVMLNLFAAIERGTDGWGAQVHFFSLPYMSDGSVITQLWVQFALLSHMFYWGFLIASLFRRFGRTGLYIFFIALLVIFTVLTFLVDYYDEWRAIGHWFAGSTAVEIASLLFLITIVYMALSYMLLRRSAV